MEHAEVEVQWLEGGAIAAPGATTAGSGNRRQVGVQLHMVAPALQDLGVWQTARVTFYTGEG